MYKLDSIGVYNVAAGGKIVELLHSSGATSFRFEGRSRESRCELPDEPYRWTWLADVAEVCVVLKRCRGRFKRRRKPPR